MMLSSKLLSRYHTKVGSYIGCYFAFKIAGFSVYMNYILGLLSNTGFCNVSAGVSSFILFSVPLFYFVFSAVK